MLCACSSCLRSASRMGSSSCAMAVSRSLSEALRSRLVAPEDFARQLEKGFAVGVERHARGAFDGGAHLRLALRQQFGRARALLLVAGDARARPRPDRRAGLRARRAGAQRAEQVADDGGRERGDDADTDAHGCRCTPTPLRGLSSQLDQLERCVQPAMREPRIGAIVVAEITVTRDHRVHARGLRRLHVALGIARRTRIRRGANAHASTRHAAAAAGCGLRSGSVSPLTTARARVCRPTSTSNGSVSQAGLLVTMPQCRPRLFERRAASRRRLRTGRCAWRAAGGRCRAAACAWPRARPAAARRKPGAPARGRHGTPGSARSR